MTNKVTPTAEEKILEDIKKSAKFFPDKRYELKNKESGESGKDRHWVPLEVAELSLSSLRKEVLEEVEKKLPKPKNEGIIPLDGSRAYHSQVLELLQSLK